MRNERAPLTACIIGGSATALGVARCFYDKGIKTTVVIFDKADICRHSRHCDTALYPYDEANDEELLEWLLDLATVNQREKPFLIPATDRFSIFLAKYHTRLSRRYLLWVNSSDSLLQLTRKDRLIERCLIHGISVPRSITRPDESAIKQWVRTVPPPYFVKPYYFADPDSPLINEESSNKKNRIFEDEFSLVDYVSQLGEPAVIVQEMLEGGDGFVFDCYGLCNQHGDVIATATHTRIRQCPAHRGVTCYGEIPALNTPFSPNDLVLQTKKLFEAFPYHGIFGCEWLWDKETDRLYLIDVNTRPFSTISHLNDCGLNLPYLSLCELVGKNKAIQEDFDIEHKFWIDFSKELQRIFLSGKATRYRWVQWLQDIVKATSFAYWRSDDMLPALVRMQRIIKFGLQEIPLKKPSIRMREKAGPIL